MTSFKWEYPIYLFIFFCFITISCSQSLVSRNENGSEPINPQETEAYKKALLRCYRQGGTRIVKIEGQLRCY